MAGIMLPELSALLAELEALHERRASERPLVVPHGKGWRVEQIGRRTIFTAPDGVAYVQCEPLAEPDAVIEWRGQRMVLPPLRLRRFDADKARRKQQRKQRHEQRIVRARRRRVRT